MKKKIAQLFEEIRKRFLQPFFRKIAGWDELQENIDTMYYILNNSLDISQFPKATGNLRKCQLADAELLRIVCEILEKHNLTYWLDYGTLLGAVRHKGFIPWDDDLDIAMPRRDYNKALDILPDELKKYDINFSEPKSKRIAISIWKAGLILDIFAMDNIDANSVSNHEELRHKTIEYRKYYKKHINDSKTSLNNVKELMIGKPNYDNPLWYHNTEFCADGTVYDNDTIYPLKKISFEGYQFNVPNKYDVYLTEHYGEYMSFPKSGMLHHHGDNGSQITNNPVKSKIDMEKYIEKLKQIEI